MHCLITHGISGKSGLSGLEIILPDKYVTKIMANELIEHNCMFNVCRSTGTTVTIVLTSNLSLDRYHDILNCVQHKWNMEQRTIES